MVSGGGWRVGDYFAAAATRALVVARVVAAGVSYGLHMNFD
jgi:hypothetical protein